MCWFWCSPNLSSINLPARFLHKTIVLYYWFRPYRLSIRVNRLAPTSPRRYDLNTLCGDGLKSKSKGAPCLHNAYQFVTKLSNCQIISPFHLNLINHSNSNCCYWACLSFSCHKNYSCFRSTKIDYLEAPRTLELYSMPIRVHLWHTPTVYSWKEFSQIEDIPRNYCLLSVHKF